MNRAAIEKVSAESAQSLAALSASLDAHLKAELQAAATAQAKVAAELRALIGDGLKGVDGRVAEIAKGFEEWGAKSAKLEGFVGELPALSEKLHQLELTVGSTDAQLNELKERCSYVFSTLPQHFVSEEELNQLDVKIQGLDER